MTTPLGELRPLPGTMERHHGLLEAPRVDSSGAVLYTDIMLGGAYRVIGDGEPETVVPKRRGMGGQLPHADGGVVVSGRTVIHSREGQDRELLAADGVQGFNDMVTGPGGAIYVGSMRFSPFKGEQPSPSEVWRIDPHGTTEIAARGVDWPNGIGFSADGTRMYASDTAHNVVRVWVDGASDPEVFASPETGAVDGLAVDEDGCVWVALGDAGIARYGPGGDLEGTVEVPSGFTSSLCFGGVDNQDVYVTTGDNRFTPDTGGTVFHARCDVAGVEVAPASA